VHQAGFTLVEVVIAISIVAFGIIAVFGLLPAGLGIFRQSIETTVSSQILQQIISEVQETDFDQLIKDKTDNPISAGTTGVKATRYFDDQGKELTAATRAIYQVNTRIQSATDSPAKTPFTNLNLATVTIQVAKNPGGRALAYETDSTLSNLWSGTYEGDSARVVPIFTASTMVSRQ
jgi:uncharacterized protein (TIGR02598 family)